MATMERKTYPPRIVKTHPGSLLHDISLELTSGEKVLIITGAGLSVASGITPYRSGPGAVWQTFVTEWGTRKKFLKSPKEWWNKFWLRTHQIPQYYKAEPNAGHHAIAALSKIFGCNVITQNIDRLHLKTELDPSKLIEVHGSLDLYKCVKPGCRYCVKESITTDQIDLEEYAINGTRFEDGDMEINPPRCPSCREFILPQALLFDEQYTSHSFYQYEKAKKWMKEADVIIFVGTSFSVGVTQDAIYYGQQSGKKLYNFNLHEEERTEFGLVDVLGRSEETLPTLEVMCHKAMSRRRMWNPSTGISTQYDLVAFLHSESGQLVRLPETSSPTQTSPRQGRSLIVSGGGSSEIDVDMADDDSKQNSKTLQGSEVMAIS